MRIEEKGWTIVVRSNQYHQLRADSGEIRVRFPATYWRTLDQCCVFAGAAGEAENDVMQTSGGYGVTVYNDNERMLHETRLYQVAPVSTNFVFAFRAEHELDLPRSCR